MKKKILFIAFAVILIGASGIWYYVFQYSETHHRTVENENAIVVSAAKIVKDYETNEMAANKKYLNKAIQVKGAVLTEKTDQAGNITVTLKSGDDFSNVFCTLRKGETIKKADSVVAIKGFCSGHLSDVVLNDAIIVRP